MSDIPVVGSGVGLSLAAVVAQVVVSTAQIQHVTPGVQLVVSVGALVTGVVAIVKGVASASHFKGVLEERAKQQDATTASAKQDMSDMRASITKVAEEVSESRQMLRSISRQFKLSVDDEK